MRATIIPTAQRDRMEDLELLAELIAQALELPADTPIKRLAVEASVAIRFWKAEEALAKAARERFAA